MFYILLSVRSGIRHLAILSEPHIQWIVYAVMFTLLLLENGVLPAAFLPGDSLLFLAGALIARGTMPLIPTLVILTCAASLGCWLGYAQGRWLSNTRIVKSWLSHLPAEYYQRATGMFHRHGLSALLAGRFLAFVRTILPALAGISGLKSARFQIFNWLSGLVWVVILVTLGYGISQVPFIQAHEQQMMQILLLIPAVLLLFGLAGSLLLLWKKRHAGQF